MDLSDRVAVITGGKRIGAVVATELARRGVDIAVCYNRSQAEADQTASAVTALGRRAFIQQANLTEARDCESFVNESAADGEVVFTVSGRLNTDNVGELSALLSAETPGRTVVLDLKDVVLVDREAVRFLRARERNGIVLRNCPLYLREWIARDEQ